MTLSMTGFASKSITLSRNDESKVTVTLNLKSLNSRFFEATCRLPFPLSHLETIFVKEFKKKLLRGHIYFTVHLSDQSAFKEIVAPSTQTIAHYLNTVKTIKQQGSIEGNLSLDTLLTLPNVLQVQEQGIDEASKQKLLEATNEVIEQLIAARKEEGTALANDLEQRIAIMNDEIAFIETASLALIDRQKEKVNRLSKELEDDESALAETRKSALYAVLDKIDIHEEIVRFKSHLANLKSTLRGNSNEQGKRLDFTLQELAREINTITAKCSDATIGSHAINIKVEIEKAREQAQNIV